MFQDKHQSVTMTTTQILLQEIIVTEHLHYNSIRRKNSANTVNFISIFITNSGNTLVFNKYVLYSITQHFIGIGKCAEHANPGVTG